MALRVPPPPLPPVASICFLIFFFVILLPIILAGFMRTVPEVRRRSTRSPSNGGGGVSGVHAAATRGDLRSLQELLNNNPNDREELLTSHDSNGQTPLSCAALGGHVQVIGYLLKHFRHTFKATDRGQEKAIPIHRACEAGRIEALRVFHSHCSAGRLEHESIQMMFIPNQNGENILYMAARRGRGDIVHYLLNLPEVVRILRGGPTYGTIVDYLKLKIAREIANAMGHHEVARILTDAIAQSNPTG